MINIFVDNYFDKKDAITVKELIEILCTYPLHEKVYAEWEGLTVPVLKENIEIKEPTKNQRLKQHRKDVETAIINS